MEQYYIFVDLDGTINKKGKGVDTKTCQAMEEARKNGHKIFLCTGRSFTNIRGPLKELPLDGMVLCAGAHYSALNVDEFTAMPKEVLIPLIEYLVKHDVGFSLDGAKYTYIFSEGKDAFDQIFKFNQNDDFQTKTQILNEHNIFYFEDLEHTDLDQVLKISFYTNRIKEVSDLLESLDECLIGYFDHIFKEFESGEIAMRSINKAYGMDLVLQHHQHPLEYTIAIGDGTNDLPMLRHAKIGIAMGNSSDKVKQEADYVTEHIDDDGFIKALKHFKII